MRFTTPSIASAGDPVFAREKCSFPRPGVPSLLSLRHPSRLPAPPLRVVVGFFRKKPRPVFSSSREGDAKMSDPKRVPPMCARALELSSQGRFCRRAGEETVSFSRRSFQPRSSFEVLTPNLPRQDRALAHASYAPLFVGVTGARFVFFGLPERSCRGKEQNRQTIDFCN